MPTTSKCRTCGADILWCTLPSGKSMPLDAKASTQFLVDGDSLQSANVQAKAVQVRASHFSTCPQAGQHRRTDAARG